MRIYILVNLFDRSIVLETMGGRLPRSFFSPGFFAQIFIWQRKLNKDDYFIVLERSNMYISCEFKVRPAAMCSLSNIGGRCGSKQTFLPSRYPHIFPRNTYTQMILRRPTYGKKKQNKTRRCPASQSGDQKPDGCPSSQINGSRSILSNAFCSPFSIKFLHIFRLWPRLID